jgi:hypothetical protein
MASIWLFKIGIIGLFKIYDPPANTCAPSVVKLLIVATIVLVVLRNS